MDRQRIHILLLEPSHIVSEGLSHILLKSNHRFSISQYSDLKYLDTIIKKEQNTVVILNPSLLQNRNKDFIKIKNTYPSTRWMALVYSYFDQDILRKFDEQITITETAKNIISKLIKISQHQKIDSSNQQATLTERETDILIHLIDGLSNKEIANTLSISIHTVISHRKNITEKTGIKSLPGLTIYAITKKIIQLDS
ncbi:MAG: hypothetical protein COB98_02955 [Flavobacteriaceae bacterium]|nr:MAG: hypothetical protein COB98_02955 [Flavobacteriaceae bacterium]